MKYLFLTIFFIFSNAIALNINSASRAELVDELKGVGPALAERIIEYREKNGVFNSAEELVQVKGIGRAVIENNMEVLEFEQVAPEQSDSEG